MKLIYNNTTITVNTQDPSNPLFSTKDICKALGIRDKVVATLLDRYAVIRLTTKRNKPNRDIFRKWFINEFKWWFNDAHVKVEPLPKMEEIDAEDVNAFILNSVS